MKERTLPNWFKLLEHDRRRLSLPFLIGALRESGAIPSDGADFEQVYWLFQDMASYRIAWSRHVSGNKDPFVYVQLCASRKVPVFSIWAKSDTSNTRLLYRACYPSHEPGNIHLCFAPEVEQEEGVDLREVTRRVFERYDHRIALSSKRYSRDEFVPVWREFNATDLSDIRAALGQPEVE